MEEKMMEKKRYKMYKKGKRWVIAPIIFFGTVGGLMIVTAQPQSTHAAEIEVAKDNEGSNTSEVSNDKQVEQTETTPVESPAIQEQTTDSASVPVEAAPSTSDNTQADEASQPTVDSTDKSISDGEINNNNEKQSEAASTNPSSSTAAAITGNTAAETDSQAIAKQTSSTSSENIQTVVKTNAASKNASVADKPVLENLTNAASTALKAEKKVATADASSDPISFPGTVNLKVYMKSNNSVTDAGSASISLSDSDLLALDQLTYGKLMTLALTNGTDSSGKMDLIRVISIFSSYNNGMMTAEDAIKQLGIAWPGVSYSNKESLDYTVNNFFSQLKGYTINDLELNKLLDQHVNLTSIGTDYYVADPFYVPFILNNFSATIHYQYADGTPAAEDRIITGYKGQPSVTIDSPAIEGYIPDQSQLSINFSKAENLEYTVTYVKEAAKKADVTIHFVDASDPTNELKTSIVLPTQEVGSTIDLTKVGLNTAVAGYTLQNKLNDQYIVKDKGENEIYLLYIKNLTEMETKKVTRTIHYQSTDGSKVSKDVVQTITFTRQITKDGLSGEILSIGDWQSDQTEWGAVKTPEIKGYTANIPQVPTEAVTQGMENQMVEVVYTPQKTAITSHDGEKPTTSKEDTNISEGKKAKDSNLEQPKVDSLVMPTKSKDQTTSEITQPAAGDTNKKQAAAMLSANAQETTEKSYPKTGENTNLSSLLAGIGVLIIAGISATFRAMTRKN